MKLVLQSNDLIGDFLMQTPAIRQFKKDNPDIEIVYASPENSINRTLGMYNPYISRFIDPKDVWDVVEKGDRLINVKCTEAFAWGLKNKQSMNIGFGEILGVDIVDEYYDLFLTDEEIQKGKELANEIGNGKPIVICARHSKSCTSNDPNINKPNKCFSNNVWVKIAGWLKEQGYVPLAIGSKEDEKDPKYAEWPGPKLYGYPLRDVAALIRACHATVSVETGIRFIASAVGTNFCCISCAVPTWLVHGVICREGQKMCDELVPLNYVNFDICKKMIQKVL